MLEMHAQFTNLHTSSTTGPVKKGVFQEKTQAGRIELTEQREAILDLTDIFTAVADELRSLVSEIDDKLREAQAAQIEKMSKAGSRCREIT